MLRGAREVANFARRMVFILNKPHNVAKPGWQDMTLDQLEAKLDEEYAEVKEELDCMRTYAETNTMWLSEECADLANVCMMITDVVGGLGEDV